jgi:alkylation response protein AidB-like acyl-CoA dehydrogenase
MLLVDMHADGVCVADPDLKMGNRVQLTSDVEFTDVFVPDEHVIAIPGRGLSTALASLAMGRIGVAAMGVGMGQCAFDHAVRHMRQRSAFGSKIGGFQHWQFRFAEHAIALESARSLYQKAARKVDTTGRPEPEAAMAKVIGSRVAVDIARDAIQVHGGYGFVRQLTADGMVNHLESIWRDSKVARSTRAPTRYSCGASHASRWDATSPADGVPAGDVGLVARPQKFQSSSSVTTALPMT